MSAIKTAKDNGIITYIDAVLNHKAGADDKELFLATMVDRNNREKKVGEAHDIEGWTKWVLRMTEADAPGSRSPAVVTHTPR